MKTKMEMETETETETLLCLRYFFSFVFFLLSDAKTTIYILFFGSVRVLHGY